MNLNLLFDLLKIAVFYFSDKNEGLMILNNYSANRKM